jgi:hypothetical protein
MIMEVIKTWDETAVIVTGDHGNVEVHTQIRANLWLIEAGLRTADIEHDDWRATFFALGGSAFLRVRDRGAVDEVRNVLQALPAHTRELFTILERDELDALGADPDAPLALAAAPGFVLDDRAEAPVLQPNPGMSHGHHPKLPAMHTGFVAKGAGIRAGASIPMLPLTCVAPLVADLLGLDFDAPDGTLYAGLLR